MMKTLPYAPAYCRLMTILCALVIFLLTGFTTLAQDFKGKDGNRSFTTSGSYILNRYAVLASTASAGTLSITVDDISNLNGSASFTNSFNPYADNAVRRGDLVMIIQMQGADINTANDANYGNITSYNNTGKYEVATVYSVSGNTIFICGNLKNSYTQSGRSRAQVVRIPRLGSLTINSGAIITGKAWDGATGGIVAVEANGNITLNGHISADAIGFRGGTDDRGTSSTSGSAVISFYRTTANNTSAGKGESIAGNTDDYQNTLNGAFGRGAPANGGGGGNGHNAGGGGGSNAGTNGALTPWNGTGIKSLSVANWASAWELEAAGFSTNISTGAGRGGYSYSNSNQDALTLPVGHNSWGGDKRQNVGGFGGRPLNYDNNTRVFMGGGGGSGDGNNQAAGYGGNGGGITYVFTNGNISGTGTITANGQNGYNTTGGNNDGAGGGGGGGVVSVIAKETITGITIQANGGQGGNQMALSNEAEGPGGGGGGGYIITTVTTVTKQVAGGANGISNSAHLTEFLPNGATAGAAGTTAAQEFTDFRVCDASGITLPVKLGEFTATVNNGIVSLNWFTLTEKESAYFNIERSTDGIIFTTITTVKAKGNSNDKEVYTGNDNLKTVTAKTVYYRLKMVDIDGAFTYSPSATVQNEQNKASGFTVQTYPNPVVNTLYVNLPVSARHKKVMISLYDMAGKLAHRIEKNNGAAVEEINLQQLNKGIYIVQVIAGNETVREKIVKN